MTPTAEAEIDQKALEIDAFPNGITPGSTVLIAGAIDPATFALGLRSIQQYGQADDAALVVTTTESADRTIDTYETVCEDSARRSLGLVDTTSERQYVDALYDETPVVFVPSPGDLERLVLALSDLLGNRLPSNGTRHLVVRSLTPILENAPISRVSSVLERITGIRTGNGLTVFGVDYTAHDEETMTALMDLVDGVVWVTQTTEGELEFEFRPTRRQPGLSSRGGDTSG